MCVYIYNIPVDIYLSTYIYMYTHICTYIYTDIEIYVYNI